MKHAFIIVTLLLGVVLVVMIFTKPDEQKHYEAVTELVQTVVEQEMSEDNLTERLAKAGAEKLADLGIEGVDAATLEKLGADVDLTEVTELGKDMAMNTAGFYLQSHMKVNDYHVVTIGLLNYKGTNLPVTIGAMGKVFVLVDDEQVKRLLRQ